MQEQQFIDYIVGLAPEGETALLVRQKPVMRGNEQQTFLDGSL